MDYVNLGKTGLKVSRLCLGMMSYGSKQEREWHRRVQITRTPGLIGPPVQRRVKSVWYQQKAGEEKPFRPVAAKESGKGQ